jgi:hypothetical protein
MTRLGSTARSTAMVAALGVMAAVMTGCGSGAADAGGAGITTSASAPESAGSSAASSAAPAASGTTGSSGDDSDASQEGVCALMPPSAVAAVVNRSFAQSSYFDIGSMKECMYSSRYSTATATTGVRSGGAAVLKEQTTITETTLRDVVTTQISVNGSAATLVTGKVMVGSLAAWVLAVDGADLVEASVDGAGVPTATVESLVKDATTLMGLLLSEHQ